MICPMTKFVWLAAIYGSSGNWRDPILGVQLNLDRP